MYAWSYTSQFSHIALRGDQLYVQIPSHDTSQAHIILTPRQLVLFHPANYLVLSTSTNFKVLYTTQPGIDPTSLSHRSNQGESIEIGIHSVWLNPSSWYSTHHSVVNIQTYTLIGWFGDSECYFTLFCYNRFILSQWTLKSNESNLIFFLNRIGMFGIEPMPPALEAGFPITQKPHCGLKQTQTDKWTRSALTRGHHRNTWIIIFVLQG